MDTESLVYQYTGPSSSGVVEGLPEDPVQVTKYLKTAYGKYLDTLLEYEPRRKGSIP